ncbi:MAG: PhoH family protein [Candidatus Omnitrophota bacterium]|jgi:phosphate starvation-inducible PhoH-like protein
MDKTILLQTTREAQLLLGPRDEHIKALEKRFRVKVNLRGEHLKVSGTQLNVTKASRIIENIVTRLRKGEEGLSAADVQYLINDLSQGKTSPVDIQDVPMAFLRKSKVKHIEPKTKGQREYVEAIHKNDIVFGIGPAGTGKTYLAMASAVEALKNQDVRRIILTRPAIEAGESLGFLPGDISEKITPYLRPLYDALYDMMEADRIEKYIETGIIEVAPLAYMRGRTLNDAFIILDEAQNATAEQMKMFLTRLGFDSKVVITGDITQSDLPDGKPVGLLQSQDILSNIEGIKFIYFSGSDVVRHELVQKIIEAYEKSKRIK